MDNNFDNTIRTYNTKNDYSNELNELIEYYNKEKTKFEKESLILNYNNNILLNHINFFDKKYCLKNITHSNTINFVISNNYQIKSLLDRLVIIYDKNVQHINFIQGKIYDINLIINRLKLSYNIYY